MNIKQFNFLQELFFTGKHIKEVKVLCGTVIVTFTDTGGNMHQQSVSSNGHFITLEV